MPLGTLYAFHCICFFVTCSDLEQRENKLRPLNKRVRDRMHRLHCLRFWLLHSVSSVHGYLMGQALHLLSSELEQMIEQAQDLDALVKGKGAASLKHLNFKSEGMIHL